MSVEVAEGVCNSRIRVDILERLVGLELEEFAELVERCSFPIVGFMVSVD